MPLIPTVTMKPRQSVALQAVAKDGEDPANVIPNPKLTWISSDVGVATVQPNADATATVQALQAGTATITSTTPGVSGPISQSVQIVVVSPLAASLDVSVGTPVP